MLLIDRPQSSHCTKLSTFPMSRGCECGFQMWQWIDCYDAVLLVWHFAPFWRENLQFHLRGLRRSGFGCRCHWCVQAHLFPSCLFSLSSGGLLNWIYFCLVLDSQCWLLSIFVDSEGCLQISQYLNYTMNGAWRSNPMTLLTDIKASDEAS